MYASYPRMPKRRSLKLDSLRWEKYKSSLLSSPMLSTSSTLLRLLGVLRPTLTMASIQLRLLYTYSHQYLKIYFTNTAMLSLLYQLFIDVFGLYRNIYGSITAYYLIP